MCSACGPFSQCLSFTQPGPVATWDPRSCPLDSSEASIQSPWDCGPRPTAPPWSFWVCSVAQALLAALGAQASAPALAVSGLARELAPYCLSLPGSPALPAAPEGLQAPLPLLLPSAQTPLGFGRAACLQGSPVSCWSKGTPDPVHPTLVSPACSARWGLGSLCTGPFPLLEHVFLPLGGPVEIFLHANTCAPAWPVTQSILSPPSLPPQAAQAEPSPFSRPLPSCG